MNLIFGATSLIGGGAGALDAIQTSPGDWTMSAGDMARITQAGGVAHYQLVASGDAEDSPYVIKPDESSTGVAYTGSLRWHLVQSGYVDRGDPAAHDFAVGDFTTDGNPYTLDLSAIVPDNGHLVYMRVQIMGPSANDYILFRKNGNSNNYNTGIVRMIATGTNHEASFFVSCDSSRIVQYQASSAVFSAINVTIRGWHIGGF